MVDVPTRPRRTRRALLTIALVVAVLAGLVATGAFVLSERLGNNIRRIPLTFSSQQEAMRPPTSAARTFLLIALDPAGRLTDTVSIVQLATDRSSAAVVTLPADSGVEVPGSGPGTLRSAYATSGPTTLLRTVEQLTTLRIDHLAVLDLARLGPVVDAVGGIEIAGAGRLDGRAGMAYLEAGRAAPAGTRTREVLRAVLDAATSTGLARDPLGLYSLVDATSRAVTLDDTLTNATLRSIAFSLRDLRTDDVTVLDAPLAGTGVQDGRTAVRLDGARSTELWQALRSDTAAAYADLHPEDVSAAPVG